MRIRIMHKKGIEVWISWVVLVAFVIFLGTMVFYWMRDFSADRITDLQDRLDVREKCDLVGIELSEVISKNAQTLNMKVTNRDYLAINQVVFSLYGDKSSFIMANISNITLKPNSSKTIDISQNSSIPTVRISAVPVIIDSGKQIYCTDKRIEANVTS